MAEDVRDEVVIRVQGVLAKNNLVPKNLIRRVVIQNIELKFTSFSCSPMRAKFLNQQAEITGLESTTFKESVAKLDSVNDLFAQHLAGIELSSTTERVSMGEKTIVASNRIFTAKTDVPTEQDTEFHNGLDPLQLLAKLKSTDLIHAPGNIVKYFRRGTQSDHR
jgi:hypothetical protein